MNGSPLRFGLRPVEPSDLPVFYTHQHDADALRMVDFRERTEEEFMAHWSRILADPETVVRTVTIDGEVAGNILRWRAEGVPQVGYWFGREYWGRGLATSALTAFLAQLEDPVVVARVAPHNIGSIRVLLKCGFSSLAEGDNELVFERRRAD